MVKIYIIIISKIYRIYNSIKIYLKFDIDQSYGYLNRLIVKKIFLRKINTMTKNNYHG